MPVQSSGLSSSAFLVCWQVLRSEEELDGHVQIVFVPSRVFFSACATILLTIFVCKGF